MKLKHHPARISFSVEQEEDRRRFTPPAENGAIPIDAMIKEWLEMSNFNVDDIGF